MPVAYQLEWSKSYARTQRWQEEVKLLKEEMRRTLEFLKWKSSLWVIKSSKSDPFLPSALSEGLRAYTFRQADVMMSLHNHFLSLWHGLEGLSNSPSDLAPFPAQLEEVMQGVEGGDIELG